jgi:DNA mismatch repair protein MutS
MKILYRYSPVQGVLLPAMIPLYTAIYFLGVYRVVKDKQLKINIKKYMQTRLIAAADALRAMQKAQKFIDENPVLSELIPCENIKALKDQSAKMSELVSLLSKDTFKGEASAFSWIGRVLAAYKILLEVKDYLVPAMEEFGHIDAQCSIAKLYKKYENKPVSFCFPEYIESERPYLEAEGFWFPSLLNDPKMSTEKIITNDVCMAPENTGCVQNIILTGPNMGGKSTILKGTVTMLLLAQTLGIVPARNVTLVPFEKIQTHINRVDNAAEGLSLFAAELERAKKLLNAIPQEPSFIIFDEPFNGTNPREAIKGSAYVAGTIANKENCMSIIATHFLELTELEEKTDGIYENFRVNVIRNDDGSLTFPYTLGPGATDADQQIALELMQQEGLTDEAGLDIADLF